MSLSKLTKISELGLSNNSLSGQILPSLITNWTNLISLQLQYNSFTGKIPPELGLLTKLNYLFLLNNKLSGLIPTEIGNLENLIMLSLSTNQLSGSIPPTIWNLKNPELLQLFANNLNGTIPPEIGNMTSLSSFNLDSNLNYKGSCQRPSLASLIYRAFHCILTISQEEFLGILGDIFRGWLMLAFPTTASLGNCLLNYAVALLLNTLVLMAKTSQGHCQLV